MLFKIKTLQVTDIKDMYQEVINSKESLEELGWITQASETVFSNHYSAIIKMNDLKIFVIRVKNKLAGVVEIASRDDHYVLGYWLGIDYRGKGLATKAINKIIKENLNTRPIFADTLKSNPKSIKVLERLGFSLDRENNLTNFYRLSKSGVDKV